MKADRVQELIPGESKGMTRHGSSSVFWLYTSKQVGGEDRQIRLLISTLSSDGKRRMLQFE